MQKTGVYCSKGAFFPLSTASSSSASNAKKAPFATYSLSAFRNFRLQCIACLASTNATASPDSLARQAPHTGLLLLTAAATLAIKCGLAKPLLTARVVRIVAYSSSYKAAFGASSASTFGGSASTAVSIVAAFLFPRNCCGITAVYALKAAFPFEGQGAPHQLFSPHNQNFPPYFHFPPKIFLPPTMCTPPPKWVLLGPVKTRVPKVSDGSKGA